MSLIRIGIIGFCVAGILILAALGASRYSWKEKQEKWYSYAALIVAILSAALIVTDFFGWLTVKFLTQ